MDRLSVRELRALVFLRGRPGASLKEVSEALGLPPSSVHGLLTRLVAEGLVEKRQGRYYVAQRGLDAIAEVRELLEAARG